MKEGVSMNQSCQNAISELREYCAKYDRIAIYGAGIMGCTVADFLKEQDIDFAFFCCTEKHKDFFEGHEVKAIDDISFGDIGIIVAVGYKNSHNVLNLLDNLKFDYYYNKIFLDYVFARSCEDSISKFKVNNGYLVAIGNVPLEVDTYYIAGTGGIGDTLYVAGFVEAYRRKNPEIKKVCMLLRKRQRELGAIFPGVDEIIVSDEMVETAYRYYRCSDAYPETCRFKNYMCAQGKGGGILERFRNHVMGLPNETQFARPKLYLDRKEPHKREHTVVLMPYANSTALLPVTFWNKLVSLLQERDYVVYTNIGNYKGEEILRETEPISKGLLETVSFCESCDAVISLRSGICDLLGFSKARLIVLNSTEGAFQCWNLKEAFDREDIYNINCFKSNECDVITEIMSLLPQ